jgi:hypothetical protein
MRVPRPAPRSRVEAKRPLFTTSAVETLYVGYKSSSTDPQGVGLGSGRPGDGVWDFDMDIEGTDSTQFWKAVQIAYATSEDLAEIFPEPENRPFWYFDHGNEANQGNTALWLAREQAGRQYVRTGAVTIWHVDDMSGVSSPIHGVASAWCGLRAPGDLSEIDPVTGSALNADLQFEWTFGGAGSWSAYPGYSNQWDQTLYRDVTIVGDGTDVISFDYRTDMSESIPNELNGSGWFNPDPTSPANFESDSFGDDLRDQLMVWVGKPEDTEVYDVNRRWLSEILDFEASPAPVRLASYAGVGSGNTGALVIPAGFGTSARIALQVKTNRTHSDETYTLHGFDSTEGAAVVDDIMLNGSPIGDFESDDDIRPRFLHDGLGGGTLHDPAGSWISTGRPSKHFGHVHNVYSLLYADDPCGPLGSTTRLCALDNNIATTSDHDDQDALPHGFGSQWHMGMVGPTIAFTGPRAAAQGTAEILAGGYELFRMQYDMHTGAMDLDQAVFWNVGAAYSGPSSVQTGGDAVQSWSPQIVIPALFFNPDPGCFTFTTDTDLDPFLPAPSAMDSLRLHFWTLTRCQRFGATAVCGQPGGGYFDNIRACFTSGASTRLVSSAHLLYQDTFTVNAGEEPVGSAAFDTTTAHLKTGTRIAPSADPHAGATHGDTAWAIYPSVPDTRLDFVFRIRPGPGSYAIPGDAGSGLVERDPSRPFWATYLASPGPVGAGDHAGGTQWDPNTWNSARMDTADNKNVAALVSRQLGVPFPDRWTVTLHESDPNFTTLGISRRRCFLVDPSGLTDDSNVCCDQEKCAGAPFNETWPPASYQAWFAPGSWADTVTIEGTKTLPDGYFTPGTHVEYFIRRSDESNPFANVEMVPDTSLVSRQPGLLHNDGQRFMEFGVLPDRWKSQLYGGLGDACLLVVDAGDNSGDEVAIATALDKLGYGKDNGAGRGWRAPALEPLDIDDPSHWVSANLGQKGLLFDWYDINNTGNWGGTGGRPGCRLASQANMPAGGECYLGPTSDMLADSYRTILWASAGAGEGVFHDGADGAQQANDVALLTNFLLSTDLGSERAVWVAGDNAATDLSTSPDGGASASLLHVIFGSELVSETYRNISANVATPAVYDPIGADFNSPGTYGYDNHCILTPDVLQPSLTGAASGAAVVAIYEDASHRGLPMVAGTYGASIHRPSDPTAGRHYETLLSGHRLASLLGDLPALPGATGRLRFLDDAFRAFNLCVSGGAAVQVGNLPGQGLNFVRGAFPNPSRLGRVRIEFTLAQASPVVIRIYDVAGRLVLYREVTGVAGANSLEWDGRTSAGTRTAPGVYFYRVSAPGLTFLGNDRRMVLLGE